MDIAPAVAIDGGLGQTALPLGDESGVLGEPALPFSAVGGTTALPGAMGSSRPTVAPNA